MSAFDPKRAWEAETFRVAEGARSHIIGCNIGQKGRREMIRAVALLCVLILTATYSVAVFAHTPDQAPHQKFDEGNLKLESGEVIEDFSITALRLNLCCSAGVRFWHKADTEYALNDVDLPGQIMGGLRHRDQRI
jgi:hypothetical protein